jgi:PAS domain S-box-containing protein
MEISPNSKFKIKDPDYVSVESSQRAYLNILEDMQAEKEMMENQRTATFNVLEDVTEAQEALKGKLLQVQTLRDTLENLAISTDTKYVMETVVGSLTKLVPFYSLSYIIWQGENTEFSNTVYINSKGPFGRAYISSIQRDFISFTENLPKNISNRESFLKQLHLKVFPEFIKGSFDEKRGIKPMGSLVVPFFLRTKDVTGSSNILGMFHIATINPKDKLNDYQLEIVHDIASVAAMNMERIRSIAATEQARLASLLRSMSNGVILFDSLRNILLLNPSASKMLGFEVQDPVQQQQQQQQQQVLFSEIEKLFDKDSIDFNSKINQLLKEGKESHITEFSITGFTYEIFLTSVRNLAGGIIGGAIIIHDITHLKEIDKMKTEFVSVASHQLRTPLTAIKLFIELLAKGDAGKLTKKQVEYIGDVATSTERMINLVNDLLNVSRLETGRLKIEPELADLEKFIANIIDQDIMPLCEVKGCTVEYEGSEEKIDKILIDLSLFRQVIHNLLTNAVRYSKNKGKILVKLESFSKDDSQYLISVKDNGISIPEEVQSRIFEKFFRADNAQKAEVEGSGLGLYVVKMIVEAYGGKIWFESGDGAGDGTTFYVTIPKKGMKSKKGQRGIAT